MPLWEGRKEKALEIELSLPAHHSLAVGCALCPVGCQSRNAILVSMARDSEAPDTPCGCTNCYRLFSFAEIEDFWDEGETPVCPCCGADNVVISTPEMIVDAHCLFAMRKTYH